MEERREKYIDEESLKSYWDLKNSLDTAFEEGIERNRAGGHKWYQAGEKRRTDRGADRIELEAVLKGKNRKRKVARAAR